MLNEDKTWRLTGLVSILCTGLFVKLGVLDPLARAATGFAPAMSGRGVAFAVLLPVIGLGLLIGGNKFARFLDLNTKPRAGKIAFYFVLAIAVIIAVRWLEVEQSRLAANYIESVRSGNLKSQ